MKKYAGYIGEKIKDCKLKEPAFIPFLKNDNRKIIDCKMFKESSKPYFILSDGYLISVNMFVGL